MYSRQFRWTWGQHRPRWKGSLPVNVACRPKRFKQHNRRPAALAAQTISARVIATMSKRNREQRSAYVRLPRPVDRDAWLMLWTDYDAFGPQGGLPPHRLLPRSLLGVEL